MKTQDLCGFFLGLIGGLPLVVNMVSSSDVPETRVLGGSTVDANRWPWMAFIYPPIQGLYSNNACGGSLVNYQWVITAAHCGFQLFDRYGVVLGMHNRSALTGREQYFNLTMFIQHPNYDPLTLNNDVAMIKLSRPATFDVNVSPITVVPPDTPTDDIYATDTFLGAECYATGWGMIASPKGQTSDVLKELKLSVYPGFLCTTTTLINAKSYHNRVVLDDDVKFCAAGVQGEDTCDGDSGGPFVCRHPDNRFYLHGITSYGTTVCGQGQPGVYTKVADVSHWINQQMYCL